MGLSESPPKTVTGFLRRIRFSQNPPIKIPGTRGDESF